MKLSELYPRIVAEHPEWDRRVCMIAARYYMGIENTQDLQARIQSMSSWSGPTLSFTEAEEIIKTQPGPRRGQTGRSPAR